LGGFIGDKPAAVISAVRYGDGFGFLGFYIVAPEYRGQGYGYQIWQQALRRLHGRNIGLDGVVAQQDNYRKSGFTLAHRNVRYQGSTTLPATHTGVVRSTLAKPLGQIPFEALATYDRRFFPADGTTFLRRWIFQPHAHALGITRDGTLTSYGVIRQCQNGFKIAPSRPCANPSLRMPGLSEIKAPPRNGVISKDMKPRYFILLIVLIATASVGWWYLGRGPVISTAVASRGTAAEIVYATGDVEPVRWAKVASVIRERIIEVCNCEGRAVAKGDVLVRLDAKEPRAQLLELQAREDFAQREFSRQSELIARGTSTLQAHERVSTDLRTIQGLISVQMEKLANYIIAAPMDGVVLRQDGEVGEIAEAGQILVRIGALKPLQVVAEVNEEDIPRVAVENTVLLRTDAFLDQRLEGKVREITPMGDPLAKTFRVRIALSDDTPLHPGMSVEANIITREKANALLVPADSLDGTTVFLVSGNRVRRRNVEVGIRGTRAAEVLSGVSEGDRVASPLSADLVDGRRVRVVDRGAMTP
jgi:RND family efflux transporter MFP subunit